MAHISDDVLDTVRQRGFAIVEGFLETDHLHVPFRRLRVRRTEDVFNRGSAMTARPASRFTLLSDYSARGNPWMGRVAWPGRALGSGWREMIERATPRDRELFGFPAPGVPYWDEQTRREVALRYPDMDTALYR